MGPRAVAAGGVRRRRTKPVETRDRMESAPQRAEDGLFFARVVKKNGEFLDTLGQPTNGTRRSSSTRENSAGHNAYGRAGSDASRYTNRVISSSVISSTLSGVTPSWRHALSALPSLCASSMSSMPQKIPSLRPIW